MRRWLRVIPVVAFALCGWIGYGDWLDVNDLNDDLNDDNTGDSASVGWGLQLMMIAAAIGVLTGIHFAWRRS